LSYLYHYIKCTC